ncbi:hypothetical protein AB0950_35475 [Streptomyces sp. NPDC007189]|uniref:hypothetical protein n=1 Tax=Streptomyces sp. NPDC007189 TaxID=3154315 RepID=UPI003451555A
MAAARSVTLDEAEHGILLTHERARHYAFVALGQLGAAANPLLWPLSTAVTYTIERWADENAAKATGDRMRVARTVGKAALATRHTPARTPDAGLGILGRRANPLRSAGPVPRRVAALLMPPTWPPPRARSGHRGRPGRRLLHRRSVPRPPPPAAGGGAG